MGPGGGPLMMMIDEGCFVSADFKSFRKGCGAGRGPTNDDEEFCFSCFQVF